MHVSAHFACRRSYQRRQRRSGLSSNRVPHKGALVSSFLRNGFTLVSVKFPIHPVTRIFSQLVDNVYEQMDSRAFCREFLKCEIARNVQTWRFLYFFLEILLFSNCENMNFAEKFAVYSRASGFTRNAIALG